MLSFACGRFLLRWVDASIGTGHALAMSANDVSKLKAEGAANIMAVL